MCVICRRCHGEDSILGYWRWREGDLGSISQEMKLELLVWEICAVMMEVKKVSERVMTIVLVF